MRRAGTPALILAIGLVFSGAIAAHASVPVEDRGTGLWYTSQWFNYDNLKDQGANGAGVKIAVIDVAMNPDVPELQGANIKVMGSTCIDPETNKPWEAVNADPAVSAHGTNVVSMLVGNGVAGDGGPGARGIVPAAEIMFYGTAPIEGPDDNGVRSYWDTCILNDPTVESAGTSLVDDLFGVSEYGSDLGLDPIDNRDGHLPNSARTLIQQGDSTALAARAAIRDGADVITISIDSGDVNAWDQVTIEALRAKVPVVIGTRNPTNELFGGGLTNIYQNNGIVAVNAIERDGSALRGDSDYSAPGSSNLAGAAPGRDLLGVGHENTGWGPELVHGTSYATPLVAGTIALGLQAFPNATADQVLQAMIRTTNNGSVHEPVWESETTGYGFINPGALLQSDPTQYPDENPLFVTSLDDQRCVSPFGQPPKEVENGSWVCYWANHPTPETIEAYWAVRDGGDPVEPGEKPTLESPGAFPGWVVVLGCLGLLVVIFVAVFVPIAISRSKKRGVSVAGAQQHQQLPIQTQYQQPPTFGYVQPPSHDVNGPEGEK